MKKKSSVYRRFSTVLISALTGNVRFRVTLMVYFAIALLLLGYVSAQVYTGVLTQEIAEIKRARSFQKEKLNRLTSDYVALSSRSRVSEYCETVLGMVEAHDGTLRRFAVEDVDRRLPVPIELAKKHSPILGPYRFTLREKGGRPKL